MTNSLAKQLSDLRVRAGDPSIREIERLLKGQGRNRSMARSTIQEKLSGKSPARLHQVLALVAAIAEFGRQNGTPLAPQEIDENTWRAKFIATTGKPGKATGSSGITLSARAAGISTTWDAAPLRNAGMTDLLDLISRSEGAPLATWLPHVASEMNRAEMSCESLMQWAAKENPREIIPCISALEEIFPLPEEDPKDPWSGWSPSNEATTGRLLRFTARTQPLRNAPIVVVGLRRANLGQYVQQFLTNIACWHLAPNVRDGVKQLQAAELTKDAENMLIYVGSRRQETRIIEVVTHFDEQDEHKERNAILRGMAKDAERFMIAIKEIEENEEMLDVLMSAIPWPSRKEYSEILSGAGYKALADRIEPPGYSDEPPF
ncbi:hypothetical protein [Streptomyces sp. NPDC015414]|uniref:hypothetical protein n=1 Tax=Streptomyces sp. NPDC015414 TaxID=3364957 RepID=UPI0036FCDE54